MPAEPVSLEYPNGHVDALLQPTTWPLTEDEVDIYAMFQQLDRQILALHVHPLQERFQKFLRRVEARLGLPAGDLGSGRYDLDGDAGMVKLRATVE